jgi:hypothetical protein
MNQKIVGLALAVGLFGAAGGIAPSVGAEGPVIESATGSGQVILHLKAGDFFRTFSFGVTKSADGSVNGQAQIDVHDPDNLIPDLHVDLDCLNVIGNVAIASGPVTNTNDAGSRFLGWTEIFAVQDNGQGATAEPDRITRTPPQDPALGLSCMSWTLDQALSNFSRAGTGFTVLDGNIQVH